MSNCWQHRWGPEVPMLGLVPAPHCLYQDPSTTLLTHRDDFERVLLLRGAKLFLGGTRDDGKMSSPTIHSLDMEKYFMKYLLASLERSHNVPFLLSWFLLLTFTFATWYRTSWWIWGIKLYWVYAFLGIQVVSNTFPCTWDSKDISE